MHGLRDLRSHICVAPNLTSCLRRTNHQVNSKSSVTSVLPKTATRTTTATAATQEPRSGETLRRQRFRCFVVGVAVTVWFGECQQPILEQNTNATGAPECFDSICNKELSRSLWQCPRDRLLSAWQNLRVHRGCQGKAIQCPRHILVAFLGTAMLRSVCFCARPVELLKAHGGSLATSRSDCSEGLPASLDCLNKNGWGMVTPWKSLTWQPRTPTIEIVTIQLDHEAVIGHNH